MQGQINNGSFQWSFLYNDIIYIIIVPASNQSV